MCGDLVVRVWQFSIHLLYFGLHNFFGSLAMKTTLNIPDELYKQLVAISDSRFTTISALIREYILDGLAKQPKPKLEKPGKKTATPMFPGEKVGIGGSRVRYLPDGQTCFTRSWSHINNTLGQPHFESTHHNITEDDQIRSVALCLPLLDTSHLPPETRASLLAETHPYTLELIQKAQALLASGWTVDNWIENP